MNRSLIHDFIGNSSVRNRISGGHLSHAYIISGPEGSGRHTLAKALCQIYVCSAPETQRPCGLCTNCRKAEAGIHPDIISISSETEDGKRLSPSRARIYHQDACIAPNEADRKVYLFEQADALSPAVQNVLLKLIEEGPAYAAFLLITEHSGQLLPTIQSRCEELKLTPIAQDEALNFLKRQYPDREINQLEDAARQCGGILGKAIAMLEASDQDSAGFRSAAELCLALAERDELRCAAFMAKHEKDTRSDLSSVLTHCRSFLHDSLLLSCGRQPENADRVCISLSNLSVPVLLALDDCICEAILRLESNAGVGHLLGWLIVTCSEITNQR